MLLLRDGQLGPKYVEDCIEGKGKLCGNFVFGKDEPFCDSISHELLVWATARVIFQYIEVKVKNIWIFYFVINVSLMFFFVCCKYL